jgi:hypothetical protein
MMAKLATWAMIVWLAGIGPAAAQAWNYVQKMPKILDFRTLAVDVEISPGFGKGDRVYVAAAQGFVADTGFYFGLQTDLHDSRTGRMVGKGVVFSRWGAAEPGDARPGPGGWAEAQLHAQSREGDFAGIRLPYEWSPGRYTFRVESRSAAPLIGQWFDLAMQDHQTNRRIEIGSLRFPNPAPAKLHSELRSFVEFYGDLPRHPTMPELAVAPEFTVRFGPPRVNGAIEPLRGSVSPSRKLPSLARVTAQPDGGALMSVGGSAPAP